MQDPVSNQPRCFRLGQFEQSPTTKIYGFYSVAILVRKLAKLANFTQKMKKFGSYTWLSVFDFRVDHMLPHCIHFAVILFRFQEWEIIW